MKVFCFFVFFSGPGGIGLVPQSSGSFGDALVDHPNGTSRPHGVVTKSKTGRKTERGWTWADKNICFERCLVSHINDVYYDIMYSVYCIHDIHNTYI